VLTIYFGRRGSGKTTSIRAAIPEMKKPVFVLDVLGNYTGYSSDGKDWIDVESAKEALVAAKEYFENPCEQSGIIVIQTGDLDQTADFLCSALWRISGGTLVADEGDVLSPSECPCFDEAIRYGRNRGIDMVFGCRRPAEISKNVTAGADIVYILNTTEPRDIEYYRDYLGDELAFRLPKLPPHTGIYKDFINQTEGEFRADPSGKIHLVKKIVQSDEKPTMLSQAAHSEPIEDEELNS
jgi:hypothetical protein